MSDTQPIPDTGRECYNCERVADEATSHRCLPMGATGGQQVLIGRLPEGEKGAARKKRRRRHRLKQGSVDASEDGDGQEPAPDPNSADPSARVQFLLGNLDDEGEAGEEAEVHPIFCEMDELVKSDSAGELQWRETARWIKFEEDVEEGGERWSKPHVATLSLFSLFEVRGSIHTGEIMLDCDGQTMEAISELLIERLVHSGKLSDEARHCVAEVLLKRHSHLYERKSRGGPHLGAKIRSFADIGKRLSSSHLEKDASGHAIGSSRGELDKLADAGDSGELHHSGSGHKFDHHFMKKIPHGAETSNILVGSTDFLEHSITAFIRLRTAIVLGDITEVPVPTRFIYVLLGPPGQGPHFHEMGRSMATLMSDDIFHDVAYLARNKDDLLSGVDEFLKSCTVLPPNEWDPSIRIEPPKEVPSQEPRKQGSMANAGSSSAGLVTSGSQPGVHPPGSPGADPNGPAATAASGSGDASPGGTAGGEGGGGEGDGGGGGGGGGHDLDPSLRMTGHLFGGLILDVKRKAPHYLSDLKDAFHVQTVGALFFLYFACLTPIITFGGLLVDATEGHLGAIESILSGALCGTTYALFSGQPLTILGSTGPVLVFETIVYKMCKDQDWDYLSFRMWVGIHICIILLFFVAFDLSSLVRYITRFTEESFASLIALIFIVEAIKKLLFIAKQYPINRDWQPTYETDFNCSCERLPTINESTWKPLKSGQNLRVPSFQPNASMPVYYVNYSGFNYWTWEWYSTNLACQNNQGRWIGSGCGTFAAPDIFFFSCLLFIGTFVLSYGLKLMRNSCFFPNRVRSLISDFAVMLAIVLMTAVDMIMGLRTPKLNVPAKFEPTLGYATRGWLVTPFGARGQNPWYTVIIAFFPALLATILIFMDQQITAVIVNRKENKLKKGLGYHLDLLVVALLVGINSVLGIPWFVAATVLSINHVMSLKIESESTAPGERPKFLGCRENRLTGFLIFLLIGLSVFMTPILQNIPMPVLYGVFLFMGISSLNGLQLVQRTGLFFMPQKYQPDYIFLRHVKIGQVHKFTIVQIACLVVLWVVKAIKAISILFPVMVLAMCFIRKALDFLFEQCELKWLDDIMPPIAIGFGCKSQQQQQQQQGAEAGMQPVTIELSMDMKKPSSCEQFNVSNEVDQTSIWKNLTGGAGAGSKATEPGKKAKSKSKGGSGSGSKQPPAAAAEHEEQKLLQAPEIVVEPPSGANTPERRESNA